MRHCTFYDNRKCNNVINATTKIDIIYIIQVILFRFLMTATLNGLMGNCYNHVA